MRKLELGRFSNPEAHFVRKRVREDGCDLSVLNVGDTLIQEN